MWITLAKIIVSCGILCFEAIVDIKRKKVHWAGALLLALMGIVILILRHDFSLISICMSESVGIFLYVISVLTEEKLGRGDAIYVIALGTILDFREMMMVCMISFFLSALIGIGLLMMKKAGRKTTMPYLPFLTGAYMMVTISNWCLI